MLLTGQERAAHSSWPLSTIDTLYMDDRVRSVKHERNDQECKRTDRCEAR